VCAQERAFELEEARDILLAEEVRLQRGRRGGGEAIAHLDLELQVGQRRGRRVVEVDHQREPEPQPGDVDRKGVDVDAVKVLLDDLELSRIGRAGVDGARRKERLAQGHQLVEHPQQVGAAAARRVAHTDVPEGSKHALGAAQVGGVALLDEGRQNG